MVPCVFVDGLYRDQDWGGKQQGSRRQPVVVAAKGVHEMSGFI
jgi:hypothetical protein